MTEEQLDATGATGKRHHWEWKKRRITDCNCPKRKNSVLKVATKAKLNAVGTTKEKLAATSVTEK